MVADGADVGAFAKGEPVTCTLSGLRLGGGVGTGPFIEPDEAVPCKDLDRTGRFIEAKSADEEFVDDNEDGALICTISCASAMDNFVGDSFVGDAERECGAVAAGVVDIVVVDRISGFSGGG